MVYAATIVKGARDYGGPNWLAYDNRFRQLAAAKQMKQGWGQKDIALWNDTFLRPIHPNSVLRLSEGKQQWSAKIHTPTNARMKHHMCQEQRSQRQAPPSVKKLDLLHI